MSSKLTKSERIIRSFYAVCSKTLPVDRKKALFLSDIRKKIGGNYLPLYDELRQRGFEVICDFRMSKTNPESRKKRLRRAYHLATAGFIVLEDFHQDMEWVNVRKKQELIQLWHAAGAFKRFAWGRNEVARGFPISPIYEKTTKAIVSAESIRKDYADAFHIDISKVLATGLPRTDIFFDKDHIASLRSEYEDRYPELAGRKIILFAPTYRGFDAEKAGYDLGKVDLAKLDAAMDEDQIMIFKWHPAMKRTKRMRRILDFSSYNERFLDLSGERDINDLLILADILITDYSSVIFEYELLHKPVIYYWYDIDHYGEDRGFFYEPEDYVYGKVAYDPDQLAEAIRAPELYEEKRRAFHRQFMSACDGHSTERVIEMLFLNGDGHR